MLGRDDPTDLYTKHLDWDTILRHCSKPSAMFEDGRATTAPKLHMLKAMWEVVDDNEMSRAVQILEQYQTTNTTHYEEDDLGLKNNPFPAHSTQLSSGTRSVS